MNIFFLDKNPILAAKYHSDAHVIKMILESAQLLSTAHRVLDGYEAITQNKIGHRLKRWLMRSSEAEAAFYKSTHVNHPCATWVRESVDNYTWLFQLYLALLNEYNFRFGKHHKSGGLAARLATPPMNIPLGGFTVDTVINNIDTDYRVVGDLIQTYRNYYKGTKQHLFKWTKREKPEWI